MMRRPLFLWQKPVKLLLQHYPEHARFPQALISVRHQMLYLVKNLHLLEAYSVSTSRFGVGSMLDSRKTPLGAHYVAVKAGYGEALMTRFVGRVRHGTATVNPLATISREDAVCTRILWLSGLEYRRNRGRFFDTMCRYIYIHGTIDEKRIGQPSSCGCIRMNNAEVCEVFDVLMVNSLVYIL